MREPHPACPAAVHFEHGAIPCVCDAIAAALKSARSDGYLAGKRMMAMSLRHHVSGYGAGLVEDVIGDYGGPRWPPPDGARK